MSLGGDVAKYQAKPLRLGVFLVGMSDPDISCPAKTRKIPDLSGFLHFWRTPHDSKG